MTDMILEEVRGRVRACVRAVACVCVGVRWRVRVRVCLCLCLCTHVCGAAQRRSVVLREMLVGAATYSL